MVGIFFQGTLEDNMIITTRCILNSIIENIDDEIVVIDPFKSNKLAKYIPEDIEIRKLSHVLECDGWNEIDKYTKEILEGIDTLIVFKVLMFQKYRADNFDYAKNFEQNKANNDRVYLNFVFLKNAMIKYNVVVNASKMCKYIYQIYIDPNEPCLNEHLHFKNYEKIFFMKRKNDNYVYVPYFESPVNKFAKHINKTCDFVFYCSAITDERKYILDIKDKIESIKNWDVHVITRRAVSKEGAKRCKQNDYYLKLAKSRYTLCIPSYDETAFSMNRFVEAFCNDCVCFVLNKCCLDDVDLTYPDIAEVIREKLLVKGFKDCKRKIKEISEEERLEILNEVKSTRSWKRMMSRKYLRKCYSKLKGLKVKSNE